MEEFFTVKETARLLDMAYPSIFYLIRTDKVKAVKWGRDWMVDAKSVRDLIKKRRASNYSFK